MRLLARQTRDADQARRLVALGSIYDGGSRAEAARLGSVTVQIIRDRVVRFNECGPTPYLHGVVRLCDLAQWIWEEFRISVSVETLGRGVPSMGNRKLSARPRHHVQDAEAAEALKKLSRRCGRNRHCCRQGQNDRNLVSARGACRAENKITRRWAKRASGRPRRTTSEPDRPISSVPS